MRPIPGLLFAATLVLGGARAFGGAPEDAPEDEGRQFAQENCQRCHAVAEQGESPLAEAPPFRTFAQKWPLDSLAEALAEGIMVGHPEMPTFELTTDQIDALIAHLASLPRN